MSEPDYNLERNMARLVEYLTAAERAQFKRELARYDKQESPILPQGYVQLVETARARGFQPE